MQADDAAWTELDDAQVVEQGAEIETLAFESSRAHSSRLDGIGVVVAKGCRMLRQAWSNSLDTPSRT
jgi:hypothetical protein